VPNICVSYLVISGDKTQLEDLRKKLNADLRDRFRDRDERLHAWCGHFISDDGGVGALDTKFPTEGMCQIELTVHSEDILPMGDFDWLTKEYPGLVISVEYKKVSSDLYGRLEYRGGEKTVDVTCSALEFYTRRDEDLAVMVRSILNRSYEVFKDEYLEGDAYQNEEMWGLWAYLLEPLIIQRARPEDLPPLLSKFTHHEHLIKQRLANGE